MRGRDRKQENWITQETLEEMRPSLKNKQKRHTSSTRPTNYIVSFRPPRLYSKTLSKTKQGRQRTNSQKLISTHMYSFLKTPPTLCVCVYTRGLVQRSKCFAQLFSPFSSLGQGLLLTWSSPIQQDEQASWLQNLLSLLFINSARLAGKWAPGSPIFTFHRPKLLLLIFTGC